MQVISLLAQLFIDCNLIQLYEIVKSYNCSFELVESNRIHIILFWYQRKSRIISVHLTFRVAGCLQTDKITDRDNLK